MSSLWKLKLNVSDRELEPVLNTTFGAPLEASFLLYICINKLIQFLHPAHLLLFFFETRFGMSSNLEFSGRSDLGDNIGDSPMLQRERWLPYKFYVNGRWF